MGGADTLTRSQPRVPLSVMLVKVSVSFNAMTCPVFVKLVLAEIVAIPSAYDLVTACPARVGVATVIGEENVAEVPVKEPDNARDFLRSNTLYRRRMTWSSRALKPRGLRRKSEKRMSWTSLLKARITRENQASPGRNVTEAVDVRSVT